MFRIGGKSNDFVTTLPTAELIGGKAKSLYDMTGMGLNVPPAFVIPCKWTFEYYKDNGGTLAKLKPDVEKALVWIEKTVGRKCLFSVRSGAPISCPGMMDTILNVGMTQDNFGAFIDLLGHNGAVDSMKRLFQMFGSTVLGVDACKAMSLDELDKMQAIKELWTKQTPVDQVMNCVGAVFQSWMSDRAIEYRKINNIPDDLGTSVTIQAMVYGNLNDNSGSGVLFTRDPSSGECKIMAEYLPNAQGEDVVAGTHTPIKLTLGKDHDVGLPWQHELATVCMKLEEHYRDMVDVEFTVESDKLYILQSRKGKRTHKAAVKIATDMINEGFIDPKDLGKVLSAEQVCGAAGRTILKTGKGQMITNGLAAGGGVVRGKGVHDINEAIKLAKTEPVILIRSETLPDDIAGMAAAVGIVTAKGGATSHAAVVSRAMNKACVTGTGFSSPVPFVGKMLVVDGDKGEVWIDDGSMVLSDGGQEDVLALARVLAEKQGFTLLHDFPVEGVRTAVRVADVFDGDLMDGKYGAMTIRCENNPDQMVVDMSPPSSFVHKDDAEVFDLMFAGLEHKWTEIVTSISDQFKSKDFKKVVLIDPSGYVKDAKKLATEVRVANTIADAFSGDPVAMPEDFITRVVGSHEMMQKLIENFGKPKGLGPVITPYDLILKSIA